MNGKRVWLVISTITFKNHSQSHTQ